GNSGSSSAVSGVNSSAIVTATAGNNTTSGLYSVEYTSVATQATTGTAANATATAAALTLTSSATSYAGDIIINGTTVTIKSGDTIEG
ncbi:hypothetical protein NL521_28685, partial [Klebsiella pneumoniae]|nr:hypothetical protein [Klebsiella pneumoniae]